MATPKNIPKVRFILPTAKQEAEWLVHFVYPNPSGWDWSSSVYKGHPRLKTILKNIKSKDKFFEQCYKYTKEFIKNNKKELKKAQKNYQKRWNRVGDKYLNILSSHFETSWPKNKTIRAHVSINPICPRYLDDWTFNVRYNRPQYLIPTSFHEILHFIYFKKWKEVFPKSNLRSFEAPHLIWRLSEIIDPIILNNHPDIKKMLKRKTEGYEEFKKIKIKGQYLNTYFTKIYKSHLKDKQPFDSCLKQLWLVAQENKRVIEEVQ